MMIVVVVVIITTDVIVAVVVDVMMVIITMMNFSLSFRLVLLLILCASVTPKQKRTEKNGATNLISGSDNRAHDGSVKAAD